MSSGKDFSYAPHTDSNVVYAQAVAVDGSEKNPSAPYAYNPASPAVAPAPVIYAATAVGPAAPAPGYYSAQPGSQLSYQPGYQPAGVPGQPGLPIHGGVPQQTAPRRLVGRWSSQPCDCFQQFCPSCLCATFCMWHPIAQLMHVLSGFTYWHSVVGFIICVVLQSIVSAFNVGIPFIWLYLVVLAYYARGRMRSLFQLPGDCCTDCCLTVFCTCCSVAQMARHMFFYKTSCETEQCTCGPAFGEDHV